MVVLLPPPWDDLAGVLLGGAAARGDRLVVVDVLAPQLPRWCPPGHPGPTTEDRWAARLDTLRGAVRRAGPVRRSVAAVRVRCGRPVWALRDEVLGRGAVEVVVPGGHDDLVAALARQLPVPVTTVPVPTVPVPTVPVGAP